MPAKETPKKPITAAAWGDVALFYPVLLDCQLGRSDPPEGVSEEKPSRFYDSTVRPFGQSAKDRLSVAICEFSAGHGFKDVKTLEIQATYVIAVRHPGSPEISEADRMRLLDQMAKSSAWPLFRNLFIHIASQTTEELPLLPNVPKLRWLKPQEETSKEPA